MPQYANLLITAGAGIVTLADAKVQCRIDQTYVLEDTAIARMIRAATEYVEGVCQVQWRVDEYKLKADMFEDGATPLSINGLGAIAVTSITYIPDGGGPRAMMPITALRASYVVTQNCNGGVDITPDEPWPTGATLVEINYRSGFGGQVPASIEQAVLLYVGGMWENRESESLSSFDFKKNPAAEHLMWRYRQKLGV
jgi:uncharacterized phiE125 gp8 family phage protein